MSQQNVIEKQNTMIPDGIDRDVMIQEAHHNLPRLYLSTFLLRSAFGVVTLLLPVYLAQLSEIGGPEFSGVQIGLIVGSIFITEIALVTIFGRLSDLMQRRVPFIVVGNLIAASSFAMFSFFETFTPLFIAHAIEGIGAAMAMGPALAMIGDSAKPEEQGEKMGYFETATFGGMAFGFFIGGLLFDTILGGIAGYGRWTFAISSLLLLGGALFAMQMREPHSKSFREEFSILTRFYRETVQHVTLIGIAFIIVIVLGTFSGIELYLQNNFSLHGAITGEGLDAQYTAILYGGGAVLLAIGLLDFFLEISTPEDKKIPLGGEDHSHIGELVDAFQDKELKKVLPAWLLVMTILGTIVTFLPIILSTGITQPGESDTLSVDVSVSSGLDTTELGLFFVGGMAILGGMQIFFGKMVDRVGSRPILLIGVTSILLLAIEVLFAVTYHPEWFNDPFAGIGLFFIVIAGITGLGVSGFGPAALAVLSHNSTEETRGTTAGIYSLLLGLGHIIGDLGGGILWDVGEAIGGKQGSALAIFIFILVLASLAFFSVFNVGKDGHTLQSSDLSQST